MRNTTKFRKLMEREGMIVAPGGFSPLCGIIAEKVGFDCLYLSGYGVAAFKCGYPDVGLMTMNESLENARFTARITNIPVIVDIDNGYGNAINMTRTISDFEQAGVAAVQIEDQVWPKRCGHMEGKELISAEEMCAKIRAAAESRTDPDLVIIARTDANTVLGFEEAMRRLKMYRKAGADILFFESPVSLEEMRQAPALIDAPLMINMSEGAKTPILRNDQLEEMGYKLAIWPSSATWTAAKQIEIIYRELKKSGTTKEEADRMYIFHEFNELIGLPHIMELYDRYKY
ncbi:isocitrate lyase/PEP mutase family protein [Bacilliculturomica massiliensis]|uniref:isocitrate lyase/PEP mutase family protein n=1 Tax=Bacilliculturomica massiliensis TaxID=1917867 RepID=UPI00103190A1|nr:isocitrate lyase/phosphoenolpyruvate mutase family protein [Bacilliculturomica massiliensis]